MIALVGFCSIGWNGVYMALITDRAGDTSLGRATGRGLVFLYCGVVVVPPVLGALHDAVNSWAVVWSVATLAVLLAAALLALGPRRLISIPSREPPSLDGPASAEVRTRVGPGAGGRSRWNLVTSWKAIPTSQQQLVAPRRRGQLHARRQPMLAAAARQ